MTISELVKQAHETAKEKGWWDREKTAPEIHMMIVSEIAEATAEARKPDCVVSTGIGPINITWDKELKELADAIIRIADYCGHKGWDLELAIQKKMEYNKTREYRHGNKKF